MKRIVVCVIVFNTQSSLLRDCFDSIDVAAGHTGAEVFTLVVDNSSDRTLQGDFGSRVGRWLWTGSNMGFGSAANLGVRSEPSDFVLFLNPDATLAPEALVRLLDAAESNANALFCGYLTKDSGVQVDAFLHWWTSTGRILRRARFRRYLAQGREELVRVGKVSGGAMFARTQDALALGPFDEQFFLYGEDADLSARARSLGYELFAVRSAVVNHVGAASQARFSRLVERARTDAAVRLASIHLPYIASLGVRLDLLVITVLGLLPGLGASSASRRARLARLAELRRWGLRPSVRRFEP